MAGGARSHYDCIAALSETEVTEGLRAITVPVLILHCEDDQVVPIANSAHKAIRLTRDGTSKTYRACRMVSSQRTPTSSTPICSHSLARLDEANITGRHHIPVPGA